MTGEIEIRLEDGRVFFGQVGDLNIEINQQFETLRSLHGGMGLEVPTFREMRIEARLIHPEMFDKSVFKKRDAEKPKNNIVKPLHELGRAITFED